MTISYDASFRVLNNTPQVLYALLYDADTQLLGAREGVGTWSPTEVVAHLILCEQVNFLQRIKIILSDSTEKIFKPVDFASSISTTQSIKELLSLFASLRMANLKELRSFGLTSADFSKTARHVKLERVVTLAEVFNTWVAHDLTHTGQIVRVMAKQYKEAVGPFISFLQRIH